MDARQEEVGGVSAAKFFIVMLIPVIILAFGVWFSVSTDLERGSVQVAGAMLSPADISLTVTRCYVEEEGDGRRLVVELEARNGGGIDVNVHPPRFQLIMVHSENIAQVSDVRSIFQPIRFSSDCAEAPGDAARIPPGSVRRFSLRFWGGSLPSEEQRGEYFFSLEYYDAAEGIVLSKSLRPEGW